MDNNLSCVIRLDEASRYFTTDKYSQIVGQAKRLFASGNLGKCEEELDKLPTKEQLLLTLFEKLREKPVGKTLRKIGKGSGKNDLTTLKGLSSLLTHVVIECEQGNVEYKILLPLLLEKISEIAYNS